MVLNGRGSFLTINDKTYLLVVLEVNAKELDRDDLRIKANELGAYDMLKRTRKEMER